MMSPQEALELLISTAVSAGAQDADALWEESGSLSVEVFEGEVKNLESSDSAGLGLRVLVDGRPGYSFTERLEPDAIRRCARDAVVLASYTDPLGVSLPEPEPFLETDLGTWSEEVAGFGPSRMLELCLEAEAEARESDARIVNIPHLGCTRSEGRIVLANSKGFLGERKSASASLGIGVVARSEGMDKMGWDGISWRRPSLFAPKDLARRAVVRAVELLGASPIPPGTIPVLLDERISASFLGIFLGAFLADAVQKGQSRLVGRIGERIAPEGFHLATNPHLPGMSGSRLFDGEGIPTRPRRLVDDGRLTGFLHNLETAHRDGLAPTGDATRGYSGRVSANFANMVVERETGHPKDRLTAIFPRFLHVVKLEGSTGCNPVSGEISIGVQGFLVEGSNRRPVDRVTISGNFFEILSNLAAWGDSYREGVQSQFVPALLIPAMQLAS